MKSCRTLLSLLGVVALFASAAAAQEEPIKLSGAHYNLNIIGHENQCPGDDLKGSNRHNIHVKLNYHPAAPTQWTSAVDLDRTNRIFLTKDDPSDGLDFQVLDGNACDGDGGRFLLPVNVNTCPDDDPLTPENEALNCEDSDFTTYQIYARALGSPKKFDFDGDGDVESPQAVITTCAIEGDQYICSTENVVLIREKGKSLWQNVTKELTSLCLDLSGDGVCDTRVDLFEDPFDEFFWNYDNSGLRLAQLRFYLLPDLVQ